MKESQYLEFLKVLIKLLCGKEEIKALLSVYVQITQSLNLRKLRCEQANNRRQNYNIKHFFKKK